MTLLVPHVDIVKAELGESTIQALTLIFESSSGMPPSVPSARFRADNPELMNVLDKLGWDRFWLKRDDSNSSYRVSGFALPLVGLAHADQLLECMNSAYVYMQDYYKEHPLKYGYYRHASGRDQFLSKVWGKDLEGTKPHDERTYKKPDDTTLRKKLSSLGYELSLIHI